MKPRYLLPVALLLVTVATLPAQVAADSAQNYPTTPGGGVWNNGDNMGFGFGPWQFVTGGGGSAGFVLGSSTQNGGDGSGNPFSSGGIDSPNMRAWGLFGNSGGQAIAVRPFASAMTVGQTFRVDFDNGFIDNGSSVGINISDPGGITLWEFFFDGGQNSYSYSDFNGTFSTGLPFTDGGLHIEFTYTGPDAFTAQITLNSGPSATISSVFENSGVPGRVEIYNANAGSNSSNNVYANNISIVPEPATVSLLAIGAVAAALCLVRTRRHN